jgi:NAD(P)-dependent dehydrogenase (short-subunit alcohol dehydrogenase family)
VASIFVTGSADGIGLEAARQLAGAGHRVVVHGRSPRADQAMESVPAAAAAAVGDLSQIAGIRLAAGSASALGPYDAAIPEGADTPVWLAGSDEPAARESGRLVRGRSAVRANPAAYDADLQDSLLDTCARLTGTTLPG